MLSDFDPQATRWAALRESVSMLAHGLLLPLGFLPSRHRPQRRADPRTLVFVHGLAANRAGFLPLQGYLRWSGFRRQYAFNYRSAGSIEALAVQLKRAIDANIRGGRIDLIAHSMGGLVARY